MFEQIPLFCKAGFFPYYYWDMAAIHADKHIMKDESSEIIGNFQKSSPTLKAKYFLKYKILWNVSFPLSQIFLNVFTKNWRSQKWGRGAQAKISEVKPCLDFELPLRKPTQ